MIYSNTPVGHLKKMYIHIHNTFLSWLLIQHDKRDLLWSIINSECMCFKKRANERESKHEYRLKTAKCASVCESKLLAISLYYRTFACRNLQRVKEYHNTISKLVREEASLSGMTRSPSKHIIILRMLKQLFKYVTKSESACNFYWQKFK